MVSTSGLKLGFALANVGPTTIVKKNLTVRFPFCSSNLIKSSVMTTFQSSARYGITISIYGPVVISSWSISGSTIMMELSCHSALVATFSNRFKPNQMHHDENSALSPHPRTIAVPPLISPPSLPAEVALDVYYTIIQQFTRPCAVNDNQMDTERLQWETVANSAFTDWLIVGSLIVEAQIIVVTTLCAEDVHSLDR